MSDGQHFVIVIGWHDKNCFHHLVLLSQHRHLAQSVLHCLQLFQPFFAPFVQLIFDAQFTLLFRVKVFFLVLVLLHYSIATGTNLS